MGHAMRKLAYHFWLIKVVCFIRTDWFSRVVIFFPWKLDNSIEIIICSHMRT